MGERDAMIEFLVELIHNLNIELDDANEHIAMNHAQKEAQNAPPDVMEVDGNKEDLEEMEGVSDIDYEGETPQPPPMGAHSPMSSESSVNDLNDF
jgi:hypothetical protein